MSEEYRVHELTNGLKLVLLKTGKFKTLSLSFFIHDNLEQKTAALNALLPAVAEQGCRLYPDHLTLQRKLENLFGAALSTDIMKIGERQVVAFSLEMANERYIGAKGSLLSEGLALLSAVITDPLLENGAFRQDYVNQEKTQRLKEIKALLNDKAAYANQKCLAAMCAEERFGVYKLGAESDYGPLTAETLYRHYRKLMAENPLELYVVGDFDEEEVLEQAHALFSIKRTDQPASLLPTQTDRPVKQEKLVQEKMAVNQAKMVLGLRTYTPYADPLFCALLVYSGLLGGFPHSKLFTKVREEAGLAYYIHTRLEQHKALMLIAAGINAADFDQTYAITRKQMADLRQGKFTESELKNTKKGLVNQLRSSQDSPGRLILFHLETVIGKMSYTQKQLIRGIEETSPAQILEVASRLSLDTIYLLAPTEEEVS